MVQPLPCHIPQSPPAGDDLAGAGAVAVPWAALASPAASGQLRGAPARDAFVPSAAWLSAGPASPGARASAPARTAASAGYAAAAASSSSTLEAAAATSSSTLGAAASAAKKATTSSKATKKSTGPLAFLDDKGLSTSQKLIRLLAYLDAKWEKDIEKRMKELAATGTRKTSSASSSSSSSSSSSGGLLGSVVRTVASVVPGAGEALSLLEDPQTRQLVSQVSGPVLAAGVSAFGFPELAPVALQLGPKAVDALASAAGSTTAGTATRPSSSSSSSSTLSPEALEKVQLAELQNVMDHQKELFSMVSNMLRAENELRMNIIQNVR
jgi:hypothetical protein